MAIKKFSKAKIETNGDCWVKSNVNIPQNGLMFHASLSNSNWVCETGQRLNTWGDVECTESNGISCVYLDGYSYVYYSYDDGELPQGGEPGTLSIWVKLSEIGDDYHAIFGYGAPDVDDNNHRKMDLISYGPFRIANNSGGSVGTTYSIDPTEWHHYCATLTQYGDIVSTYIDGVKQTSSSFTLNTDSYGYLCIGTDPWDMGEWGRMYGYASSARIYNRALSDAEVLTLSQEFVQGTASSKTSAGFDEFGYPIAHTSASEAGCNFITIPTEGLLLYVSFKEDSDTAESGQRLVKNGDHEYTTFSGIPCVNIDSGYIKTSENSGITGTQSRTFSFWAYPTNDQTFCNAVGCGASKSYGRMFNCGVRLEGGIYTQFTTWGNDVDEWVSEEDDKLHHFAYVYDSTNPYRLKIYTDGVLKTHEVDGVDTQDSPFWMGESGGGGWNYTGYLSSVRCYNRVLTDDEIQMLYKEFDV